MPNTYFQFKQFRIEQDKCAMKVGTDGVLLGAWADSRNTTRILDVGTGTGLIAIMLAQRSSALIDAIEIDGPAFLQASENARNSSWLNRLNIIHTSFEEYIEKTNSRYDLIVSNPPYHKETIKSPHTGRRLARHSPNLEYNSILSAGSKLLASGGKISLILPYSEKLTAHKAAESSGFFCTRLTIIFPVPAKEPSRCLFEFSREFQTLRQDSMVIEETGRHGYSQNYIQLTRDFYLNF
jgi:tRNA1Val (adenine37-N6)-methyltransferase